MEAFISSLLKPKQAFYSFSTSRYARAACSFHLGLHLVYRVLVSGLAQKFGPCLFCTGFFSD